MTQVLSANRFLPMPTECKVGEFVKIILPGERCWAEVLEVIDGRDLRVRIDNDVGRSPSDVWPGPDGAPRIEPLHTYKFNDVVTVRWQDRDGYMALYVKTQEPEE